MREALIDLSAIRENVAALRASVDNHPAMVVVKANAYGHGAVPTARAALDAGAAWLGVVDLDEALELRTAGITSPLLAWIHDPAADFDAGVAHGIDLGVNYAEQLERVAAASGRPVVQFKVDTGLGRNGIAPSEWERVFARAAELERLGRIRVRGLFSHLAGAGRAGDEKQLESFESALGIARAAGLTPDLVHLTATAGSLDLPQARFDLVRLGIGAYGVSPDDRAVNLRPAMQLSASIVSVKRVPAGSGVSYGYTYVTAGETTLALVPLGYADGVPRHASNAGPVSINGVTYRVSGRVAMDQIVVDVGDAPVKVGDRAILFGDPATGVPSADDWAAAAGTINYEIVTRIGHRVTRRYLP